MIDVNFIVIKYLKVLVIVIVVMCLLSRVLGYMGGKIVFEWELGKVVFVLVFVILVIVV